MMPTKPERTRTGRPRLRCTDDVLYHWADRIDAVAPDYESFNYSSMICEGDRLFHYGHHFELARIMRDKRGRARLVLLNGDSWNGSGGFGPSTASRQSDARRVANLSTVPNLTVPFSALEGAGIDFDTIRPIHVRDDRETIEEHSSRVRPTKHLARMKDPNGATRMEMQWVYNRETHRSEQVEVEVPVWVDNPNETESFNAGHGWCRGGAKRGEDGIWRWLVHRHWLGDSIFRARCTENRTRKPTTEEIAEDQAWRTWTTQAEVLNARERELRRKAWKLDDRYGRHSHDGDYRTMTRKMFAAQGFNEAADRVFHELEAHRSQRVWSNGMRNGRMPITVTRWATFLSSFDYQERQPLYFLCELPYGAKPNTVDEAIEALKPPEVAAALARGLAVVRQGDLFAIATKLTNQQVKRMGTITKRQRVLGTNHSVTEGVVCKGGAVLGRGIMRHEPEGWREPDHARQKLGDGKTWHMLVRNTVPRSR
jgi:hypothetical protein